MRTIDPKFENLKRKDKMEYYSRQVSNIHAVVATTMSVYGVWFNCEDGGSIFSSDACLMQPQKVSLYLMMVSSAYCFYDLFIVLFKIGLGFSGPGGEFIFHHVVGIAGAVTSIALGRQNPGLAAAALVSETSNFAMNIRWFMLKHGKSEHYMFLPVSFLFALCFLLSRVVFMFMIQVRNIQAHYIFDITK